MVYYTILKMQGENMKLSKSVLLFDGAMGTYIAEKYGASVKQCEYLNLTQPNDVLEVHREYILAGADAIKTNTFCANTVRLKRDFSVVCEIIRAACQLAKQAAEGTETLVFADIGPMDGEEAELLKEYHQIIDLFLECGLTYFLFETFTDYRIPEQLAAYVKSKCPDAFVVAECTVTADHYTSDGVPAAEIVDAFRSCSEVDAFGFNCTCGPMHLYHIAQEYCGGQKPMSIMPNAGYPMYMNGRTVFQTTPEYFAEQMAKIRACGVQILGGCCGTTPEHIRKVRELLREHAEVSSVKTKSRGKTPAFSREAVSSGGRKIVAVELDSPFDADAEFFLESAQKLARHGVDLITIADCPVARARADSSMLAAKLKREYGIDVMPHLTCRDRNLNATKALLLGMNIEGIDHVLVVTGDPISGSDRGQIKTVFQFNSVKLTAFIHSMNQGDFSKHPFTIATALNLNVPNFSAELEKAKRKEEAGSTVFLTQPVFTEQSKENLALAKRELSSRILGGILPVISYRNACFMNNEVAGITIPQEIVALYEGKTKEEAADLAVTLSLQLAEQIQNNVDGYYLMTPLKKVDIVCAVVDKIKEKIK